MAALNHSLLEQHYGRPDIKVFQITENDNTYSRLFYRSTGSGNNKFKNLFTDTLVPFYGMKTDKDNTIIKAIMKREDTYKAKRTLFKWQLDLLNHLKKDVNSDELNNLQTLLDNYFNTPGEILISINDNKGFWKNNKDIINKIKNFLDNYKIIFENITENYDLGDDTNTLYVINDTNMRKNWLQTLQIIEEKRQEERLAERLKNISNKKKKGSNKKTVKKK
mgnify:CR=1 FL=1